TESADLTVTKESAPAAALSSSEKESRVTEDEDRAVGAVRGGVYLQYVRALGGLTPLKRLVSWPLLVGGAVSAAALPLLQKSWLAFSSNLQSGSTAGRGGWLDQLGASSMHSILIYGSLGLLTLVGVLLNRLFWLERGIAAGRDLHDGMLAAILKA